MITIDNPLLEQSLALLSLVKQLRAGQHTDLNDTLRTHVKEALETQRKDAVHGKLSMKLLREAQYALIATLDEAIAQSSWEGKEAWLNQPLQVECFNDHTAGEGFFQRLAELRQDSERFRFVLEVFYACLLMGFQGQYHLGDPTQLEDITASLHQQLIRPYSADEKYPAHHRPDKHNVERRKPYAAERFSLPIVIIFLLVLYFSFWTAMQFHTH